jgi:hypothetical protein
MKKVYTTDENEKVVPLLHITESKGVVYTKYVYKAINAWGDSFRAQEFYTTNQKSVLDNGFDKVNEVEDDVIVNIYKGGATSVVTEDVSEKEKILISPKSTESVLTKMGAKKVSKGQLNIDGQFWYLDRSKWNIMNKGDRNELYIYPTPDQEIYVGDSSSSSIGFTTDVEFYQTYLDKNKPESVSQEEWDALSYEEKNKINEC